MYRNKTVSVILPAYNEEENVRAAIDAFLAIPFVDEVVAVDNNSTDRTAAEIRSTRARYVHEGVQGYGAAMQRGLREATGDLLVTVEPDGTFSATDLERLLEASGKHEAVFGTRTVRTFITTGANMGFAIRMGNWAVAKFMMILFNGPSLSDSGCTFRLLHRSAYERIRHRFHVTGSHFLVDMMIRCMQARVAFAEVPVHYGRRIGTSKITGKTWKAARLGWRIIFYAIGQRFRRNPFRSAAAPR